MEERSIAQADDFVEIITAQIDMPMRHTACRLLCWFCMSNKGRQNDLTAFLHSRIREMSGDWSLRFMRSLEPFQDLCLDPPHPAFAKLHPLGELPGRLKAGDVLRRIKNELPE